VEYFVARFAIPERLVEHALDALTLAGYLATAAGGDSDDLAEPHETVIRVTFDAESGDVAARAVDIERVLLAADVPTRHFGVGPEPVE